MSNKADTLETVLMAIELLKRIPRNRKVSASELHAQLIDKGMVRDIRTIQRLLEVLSERFDIERGPEQTLWLSLERGLGRIGTAVFVGARIIVATIGAATIEPIATIRYDALPQYIF